MSADIHKRVAECAVCNSMTNHQSKEPLRPHPIPDLPWTILATEIFEWNGLHYLILIESYSGWFEIDSLPDMTSASVIQKLKRHFATPGSPDTLPVAILTNTIDYYSVLNPQIHRNILNIHPALSSYNIQYSNKFNL